MSLLMDALKKAELAKRKAQVDSTSISASVEPSTASDSASAAKDTEAAAAAAQRPNVRVSSLPSLEHLELLDDEFMDRQKAGTGHAETPPLPAGGPMAGAFTLQEAEAVPQTAKPVNSGTAESASQQEAVQNLFATKQAATSSKTFGIAAGGIGLLAAIAIGIYFWYQLQPKSGLQASTGVINRPPAQAAPTSIAAPTPPAANEPAIPGLSPAVQPALRDQYDAASEPVRQPAPTQEARLPAVPPKKLFQVSTAAAPRTDPALERGYDALKRNDPASAKAAYEQALRNDPHNIDALSGLAVLAQRTGNPDQAADYYLRMLEADPHSALALAGLINLQSQMNAAEAETRLKQALATQPDSAALNFSLGNVYARSKRWSEAQQAYFKAMSADPGNPDYLFNLAISLEQIRQPRLAANYYMQALAASNSRPSGFDKDQASARLQQLQQ